MGSRSQNAAHILQKLAEGKVHRIQFQFSGFHLGQIQNVADQIEQGFTGAGGGCHKKALLAGKLGIFQKPQRTQNPIERGSDFMAHHGQKARLGLACFFGTLKGCSQGGGFFAVTCDIAQMDGEDFARPAFGGTQRHVGGENAAMRMAHIKLQPLAGSGLRGGGGRAGIFIAQL